MKLISINVNVSKITKSRLYKGKKGTYCEMTLAIDDEPDEYGKNVSVWEGQTKEEREQKVDRNFLGGGKIVWTNEQPQMELESKMNDPQALTEEEEDDLPF